MALSAVWSKKANNASELSAAERLCGSGALSTSLLKARALVFLNALEMCLLLLDIQQLLITAGNLISSKCFEVPSDLGTTCSKLTSGKARRALVHMSPPMGMDRQLRGLRFPLLKEKLPFPLRKSKCLSRCM